MAVTTSSNSCTGFFNARPSPVEPKVRAPSGHACGKLDQGVATWLINGVSTAFFTSLDRCFCIRIATMDDGDEANDMPLIFNDGNYVRRGGARVRRRSGKGKKSGGGAILVDEDH